MRVTILISALQNHAKMHIYLDNSNTFPYKYNILHNLNPWYMALCDSIVVQFCLEATPFFMSSKTFDI